MPYSAEHKTDVRKRIVEQARVMFNREGFSAVSIDQLMAGVGLTRGGFYNHFRNKEELYAEAVTSFLNGRGKTWRDEAGVDPVNGGLDTVRAMVDSYLSPEHLKDIDGQCPMIALPSDVARGSPEVKAAYGSLLKAMSWLFENNLEGSGPERREKALALSATCVGGMVLSRTLDDEVLANDVRVAARNSALTMLEGKA